MSTVLLNTFRKFQLILKCRLLDRIIEAWKDNEQKQTQPKGVRQGYMGHLINIANLVAEQCKENSSLDTFITEHVPKDRLEAWNDFANSDLEETNKVQRITLVNIILISLIPKKLQ